MTETESDLDRLQAVLERRDGRVRIPTIKGTPTPTIDFGQNRKTVSPEEHELRSAIVDHCRPGLVAVFNAVEGDIESVDTANPEVLWGVGRALLEAEDDPVDACLTAVGNYLEVEEEWVKGAMRTAELFDSTDDLPEASAGAIASACLRWDSAGEVKNALA